MAHDKGKLAATLPSVAPRAIALPTATTASFNQSTWRNVLATGVASAALFAYSGRPVNAQTVPPAAPCNTISGIGGSIVTCSGDVSTGVRLNNGGGPFTTLDVNNLTSDITPASGVDGIFFTSVGGVTVNSDTGPFAIVATGVGAEGIFARSTTSTVTVTGTGDISSTASKTILAQSDGGPVSVTSIGTLTAFDDAIFAQSQSGAVTVEQTGDITSTTQQGIYAKAFAGTVSVTTNGTITTSGEGIYAVGSAGASINVAGDVATSGAGATGIFGASDSGPVTINSTADISTTGGSAVGVQGSAQDDLLTITSSGNIATSGNNSFGIAAGTVYGGIIVNSSGDIATTGTLSAGINVGTIGTLGTPQGAITINSSGDIATTGSSAIGINASTVYGPITINSMGDIAVSGAASIGINVQTQGEVEISSTGNIAAGPDSSVGILALSQSRSVMITSTGDIATAGQTGIGIYARAGEVAAVFSSGAIVTLGDNAPGIAASGYTGTAVFSTGNIRTFGDDAPGITAYGAGDVAVASTGSIITTGDRSDGINVVSSDGTATVVNSGDIAATGTGSAGIYAAGYNGTSVMNFGAITGCPCGGVILRSDNGGNNLVNFGSIIADLTGSAIEMDSLNGSNLVENFGTVSGSVLMAGVTSVFDNKAGALFNSGDDVIADVRNDGTINPGGSRVVATTVIDGNLRQSTGGTFAVDINGSVGDLIEVSDTADLAGKVAVALSSLSNLPTTAVQSYLIVQALGGVTNNGLSLTASPLLHATLTFPNATDVVLGIAVDFQVDELNPNQQAIAGNLGEIFLAGSGAVSPVLLGLFNVDGIEEFKSALNQLLPEVYSDAQIAALYSSLAFSNSLLSCKVNGPDTAAIMHEGQCLWAGANARFLDTGSTTQQIGFTETAGLFNAGAQVAVDNVWRLGFGAGYQSSTLDTATGAQSEGSLAQAGVSVKYNPGSLLLAGVVSGGAASYETTRPMAFGGFSGVAEGDQDLGIVSGGLRAAYVFGTPQLFFKPILDANLTYIEMQGFTESGGGGAALTVAGGSQTVLSVAPTLEVGSEWWLGNGTLVRPLIRGGAVWYDNPDFALVAGFAGAPAGVGPFTINTDIDQFMGVVGVGIDLINGEDDALRLSYDAQLGETTQIQSVGIKGSAKF